MVFCRSGKDKVREYLFSISHGLSAISIRHRRVGGELDIESAQLQ